MNANLPIAPDGAHEWEVLDAGQLPVDPARSPYAQAELGRRVDQQRAGSRHRRGHGSAGPAADLADCPGQTANALVQLLGV